MSGPRKSAMKRQSSFQVQPVVKQHGLEVNISAFEEMDASTHVYVIQVKKDGVSWEVRKRYSEFRFFQQAVSDNISKMKTEFPPKHVGKSTIEQLERRKLGLNQWLNEFLDTVPLTPSLTNQVYAFLAVYENTNPERAANRGKRIDLQGRIQRGQILKAGVLTKLGGNKQGQSGNWKKRYCVLQDDIHYYEDEAAFANGGAPKGVVKLNAFFVTRADEPNPHFEFTVQAMPYSFTCRAETESEMNSWVDTLASLPDRF